ncbi:hypothetical protein K7432_014505, partial [Basidiobolus ranarum]
VYGRALRYAPNIISKRQSTRILSLPSAGNEPVANLQPQGYKLRQCRYRTEKTRRLIKSSPASGSTTE